MEINQQEWRQQQKENYSIDFEFNGLFFACECYYYYGKMQLFLLQVLDFIDVEQNCYVYLFHSMMIDDMHEYEWFSRYTTQSFYFRIRNMFCDVWDKVENSANYKMNVYTICIHFICFIHYQPHFILKGNWRYIKQLFAYCWIFVEYIQLFNSQKNFLINLIQMANWYWSDRKNTENENIGI